MNVNDRYAGETVPLGDVLDEVQSGFASGIHNITGEGIPHLRPMNVSIDGVIDRGVVKYVDPAAGRDDLRLRRGDILFNNTNSPELVGKTALFEDDDRPAFSNHMTRVRVDEKRADPRFVALQLHQAWREGWFAEHCNNHVSQASVSRDVLRTFPIELPSLDIQQRVANLATSVDQRRRAGVLHVSAAASSVERLRASILHAACSGRLTADWRERNRASRSAEDVIAESRDVLASRGDVRPTEAGEGPEWLDLPDTWRWTHVDQIGAIRSGIQKQPKRAPHDNRFPYLRVANVLRGKLDLAKLEEFELFDGELETYRLKAGDLLIVEGNGSPAEVGRAALWRGEVDDCVHQNHIIRVRFPLMDPEFVDLFWNSMVGARAIADVAITTAGLYSLSTRKVASAWVPVAPLDEQHVVVTRALELLAIVDGLEERIDSAYAQLNTFPRVLIPYALRAAVGRADPKGRSSAFTFGDS